MRPFYRNPPAAVCAHPWARRRASYVLSVTIGLLTADLVTVPQASAQENLTGIVVDAGTNQPLPGAQVVVPETTQGTITGANGRFLIAGLDRSPVTLEVVLLGYQTWTQQVAVDGSNLVVTLEQRALELDAVVVTGTPGAQQLRSLGNSVGQIDAAERLALAPPPDMTALLGAEVPGLQVMASGGAIGSGANIRLRGAGSLALASNPLVYVDGVRVNNDFADQGGGISGVGTDAEEPPSRLNDINPDDIASIEVIKGPAAATLYGTEASNGVINIITKKGRRGEPTITLTVKQGANWLPSPEELFPSTYYRCQGTWNGCTPGEIVEFNVLESDRTTGQFPGDTVSYGPWFETGLPQGYGASLSGGSERVSYYFSLDWDRDEGPVSYNWQNHFGGRANLHWTPSEQLDVQLGFGGLQSELESSSAQQPLTTAIIWSCPAPGCEPGSEQSSAVDGAYRGYIAYLPERYEEDIEGLQDVARSTYSLTLNHRPTEWLSHRLTAGADFTSTENSEFYRTITGVGHTEPQGLKSVENSTTDYLSLDYAATATLAMTNDVALATSVGVQYHQKQVAWQFSSGERFPVPALETVGAGAIKDADEGFSENKTFGTYVQEQLSWRDRAFLTAAVRGDDNSAFGKNFDFVTYPKVSAAWVLSEEPFFARIPFVNTLKLRAAWGQAGQQPDVFAALRTFEPATGVEGTATLTPENIGNPDLKPEVGQELEVGFDAGLLDERVGVEFTLYDQVTKDAIVEVPVIPSLGFPGTQFRNLGKLENRGIELGVDADVYRGAAVGVNFALTLSTIHNEVLDLGGLPAQVQNASVGQYHVQGFPIGTIFAPRVVRADVVGSGAEAVATNVLCEGGEVIPDTPNLSAGGGAPVPCAEAPLVERGSPLPTRQGSLSATVTLFRDLQLFAQADYVGGHTMLDGNSWGAHLAFGNSRAILERTDPILLGYEATGGLAATWVGVYDASFAKLRTVSASYTFPGRWSQLLGAERATLTLTGRNLWTIWQATEDIFGYPIIDPEVRRTVGAGTDPGGLDAFHQEGWPQIRRVMATLRLTF